MFYHQVLLRRRGQFGIIWMEAMQSSPYRITKRQALQVNVMKSCFQITSYIKAKVRDDKGKTTRFSLYLSAHLMYGVISIWRKQVHVLLAEAQEVKSRVGSEIATIASIDMRPLPRLDQINIPDALSKVAEEDPFFGSLKRFDENWDTFLQERVFPDVSSPAPSLSPPRDRERVSDAAIDLEPVLGSPHTVSSKAEITMKELPFSTSPLLEVQIPGEMDIPELNGQELEVVGDQPEQDIVLTLQDLYPEVQAQPSPPAEQQVSPEGLEKTPEKAETKKVEGRGKGEKKKRKKRDADDLDRTPAEELEEQPRPKRPAREPDIILEPMMEPEVTPPQRTRPRRQLVFEDDRPGNKQLSRTQMKRNFSSTDNIVRQFVLPQTSLKDTPARLFKEPGLKGLSKNPLLRRMWERNCQTEEKETDLDWSLPDYDKGHRADLERRQSESSSIEEVSSQEERGARPGVDQPMEDIPAVTEEMRETPSMETVREGSLSRSRTPQHSSLLMPVGQSPVEDRSISLTGARDQADRSREGSRRGGSTGESSSGQDTSMHSLNVSAPLEVLPEEVEEMLLSPPPMPRLPEEQFTSPQMRFIRQCEEEGSGKYTTFRALCPPKKTPRPRAAKCFIALLEQCARGVLFVRQRRPYGDIYISTSRRTLPHSPR